MLYRGCPEREEHRQRREQGGYDAGKKVSGIKRHIAVDLQGLPHAIHVTTANVTDRAGALAMFDHHQADLSQVQKVLVDRGYTGKPFAEAVRRLLGATYRSCAGMSCTPSWFCRSDG